MSDSFQFEQKPVILVVGDTPQNLAVVSSLLKDAYTVKVANRGARAIQAASGKPVPDLILLDIMMPKMDGYDEDMKRKKEYIGMVMGKEEWQGT